MGLSKQEKAKFNSDISKLIDKAIKEAKEKRKKCK